MVSFKNLAVASLAATASAMPSAMRLKAGEMKIYEVAKRQNEAAVALGLGELDVLQFALTLEHLEAEFYREALSNFPDDAALAAHLSITEVQAADIRQIGATESAHVSLLTGALARAGINPVQKCTYDFSAALADPASLMATASVLENVGVSAYLGAAPLLLTNPQLLGVAASILTVEARHQSVLRVLGGREAVPNALDVSLGVKSVFSLAAPFFVECPEGSNLLLEAFPPLQVADDAQVDVNALQVGVKVRFVSEAAGAATHCAFTSGAASVGGSIFTTYTEADGCDIPNTIAGVTYVSLTSSAPLEGILNDDITVAGPMAVTIS